MGLGRRRFVGLSGLAGLGILGAVAARYLPRYWFEEPLPTNPILAQVPESDELVLRFAAIGDSGAGTETQRMIGSAMADWQQRDPYDLVVMAGDNIYNSGEISRVQATFEEPYAALLKRGVQFRAALGNHDIRTDNGNPQVKYAGFNMDDRYYTYTHKGCQFFVLETNPGADWPTQLTWLKQELAASTAAVKIVYGHHPIYSSGHYGTNPLMVKRLTPMFKKYGVQLYLNGHDHHYERSAPINGTTYLVTGHGGAYLRPVGKSKFTEFALSRHGFSLVEIRTKSIVIQGIDRDGKVFDRGVVPISVA
ncbi:metallophosphoesterase [filamentous cyanobacterium LEGE 11480]|uniref:Metallophosphoesterase n=1 Tax=Romeriopsis navalis LEGE 11480 TaxID=2777977 RepID=A0A928Z2W1_9CYAN|nr:metallophosphoesterase [Romeriopsis navalis]MBE9028548.1 metallophosphoesterase [Romeriopsis navalis LEGE 11480]